MRLFRFMFTPDLVFQGYIHFGEVYGKQVFFLYHSCDEWVIGDLEMAKKFRDDLNSCIEIVEKHSVPKVV